MAFLIVLLVISFLLNVGCIWYIKNAVKKLWFVSENIGGLLGTLEEYRKHLELVNSMETYYGDAIIENLIKHTKNILKEVTTYREIYAITHDTDIEEEPNPEEESNQ